jgi:hypothetical protein
MDDKPDRQFIRRLIKILMTRDIVGTDITCDKYAMSLPMQDLIALIDEAISLYFELKKNSSDANLG